MPFKGYYQSPIGLIEILGNNKGISRIMFIEKNQKQEESFDGQAVALRACITQLSEYFAGIRKVFDLPLAIEGTAFQQAVWKLVYEIPYAKTVSYKKLAIMLGDRKKTRAVGMANGKNKLPIVIPCHRIIGTQNQLVGYAGGVAKKSFLLQLEQRKETRRQLAFF